jgi:hypothetical protein
MISHSPWHCTPTPLGISERSGVALTCVSTSCGVRPSVRRAAWCSPRAVRRLESSRSAATPWRQPTVAARPPAMFAEAFERFTRQRT